ncbi:hypothetical protein MKW94_002806 [Papaver nudicaule]|uniref:Late embryogenesis abundant protein LEA-2 subgroup domain-containing protein n=1 Tax=Papaver nudicaule TaxID=74823 RepID=A0AA41RYR1_PAPNU|nr:hypothetical protein [Papaver nudicaule]MCL7045446.1 hypothetical protein [Papaver nudicaule]
MSRQHEYNPHFLPKHKQQQHQKHQNEQQQRQLQQEHQNLQEQQQREHQQEQEPQTPQREQQIPRRETYHHSHGHRHDLKLPNQRRTKPTTWFIAFFCAILWVMIILGGLIVLIVYLVFRPKNPRFDVPNATLNAIYLDTNAQLNSDGSLLNSDVTILTNFTNPNQKVKIDYSYMVIELYYMNTLIATTSVNPFSAEKAESKLLGVHFVTSQVKLSSNEIQQIRKEVGNNTVKFDVQGKFRTRSNFGSLIHYSYWLNGRCTIVFTSPPYGALVSKKCITKR